MLLVALSNPPENLLHSRIRCGVAGYLCRRLAMLFKLPWRLVPYATVSVLKSSSLIPSSRCAASVSVHTCKTEEIDAEGQQILEVKPNDNPEATAQAICVPTYHEVLLLVPELFRKRELTEAEPRISDNLGLNRRTTVRFADPAERHTLRAGYRLIQILAHLACSAWRWLQTRVRCSSGDPLLRLFGCCRCRVWILTGGRFEGRRETRKTCFRRKRGQSEMFPELVRAEKDGGRDAREREIERYRERRNKN